MIPRVKLEETLSQIGKIVTTSSEMFSTGIWFHLGIDSDKCGIPNPYFSSNVQLGSSAEPAALPMKDKRQNGGLNSKDGGFAVRTNHEQCRACRDSSNDTPFQAERSSASTLMAGPSEPCTSQDFSAQDDAEEQMPSVLEIFEKEMSDWQTGHGDTIVPELRVKIPDLRRTQSI